MHLDDIPVHARKTGPLSSAETEGRQWIRFSLPLAAGGLAPEARLSLVSPSGRRHLLQSRALAQWPDGSARWLDCQAIVGEPGTYSLEPAEAESEAPEHPVVSDGEDGRLEISNGLVGITLSGDGDSPVECITQLGKVVAEPGHSFVSEFSLCDGTRYGSDHLTKRNVVWLQRGPVSTSAEVRGTYQNGSEKAFSYRLRARVFASLPVIELGLWVIHDDADVASRRVAKLTTSIRWRTTSPARRFLHQNRYSLVSVGRDHTTAHPVELRGAGVADAQVRVHNPECLEDPHDYPEFMCPPLDETKPFLGLLLDGGWVACHVEDFIEKCPRGLTSRGNDLTIEVWPEWAGALLMKQGKSILTTFRLVFGQGDTHPGASTIESLVEAATDTGQVSVPVEAYAAANAFHMDSVLPKQAPGCLRFDRYLSGLMALETPIGLWDLGDTRDPGYSATYASIGRLKSRDTAIPARFAAGGGRVIDWSNPDQFEPVWANNEYDVIVCMARELMRSASVKPLDKRTTLQGGGETGLWQKLKWFGRHAVEVDFIHYSDHRQLHHGSPAHSVEHDRASSYPSHLWSEGLLAYYCLSGDDDALDVVVKTGDYIARFFSDPDTRDKCWKFTRELGWGLLHVATVADLTREERFVELATAIADFLLAQEIDEALYATMVRYAFGYASLSLGVEAVTQFSDEPKYGDWLVEIARGVRRVIEEGQLGVASTMNLNFLLPAYEITHDEAFIRCGMGTIEALVDSRSWTDPLISTKQSAMLHRGLARFLKCAHELGFLDKLQYLFAGRGRARRL